MMGLPHYLSSMPVSDAIAEVRAELDALYETKIEDPCESAVRLAFRPNADEYEPGDDGDEMVTETDWQIAFYEFCQAELMHRQQRDTEMAA